MSRATPRTFRVIISVTRDFALDVAAETPRQARELARDEFATWSPFDEMCSVSGADRIRVRLAAPPSGRCPFTEEFWPSVGSR